MPMQVKMLKCEISSVIFFTKITLLLINSGFKKETMAHRKMSLISLSKDFKIQSCMLVSLGKLRTFNSIIILKENHKK